MLTSSYSSRIASATGSTNFIFRKAAFDAVNAHFVANGIDKILEAIAKFCREQLRLDLDEKERYKKAKCCTSDVLRRHFGTCSKDISSSRPTRGHLSCINGTSVHVTNIFRKHYGDKPPG